MTRKGKAATMILEPSAVPMVPEAKLPPYLYTPGQVTRPRRDKVSRAESMENSLNYSRQEYEDFPPELEQALKSLSRGELDELYVDIARRLQVWGAQTVTQLAHLKLLGRRLVE